MINRQTRAVLRADQNKAAAAIVCDNELIVTMRDGRVIHCPLVWFPWLLNASPEQQADLTVTGGTIFWNKLEDGISIETILLGVPIK